MIRLRPHLARTGATSALIGLTAAGLAGPAAADPPFNAPADVQTLMSHLSGGYTPADCHPETVKSGSPAVAAVGCGDNTNHDPGGPWWADYVLYANTADLNADFQRDLADPDNPVQPFPDGTKGPTRWNRGGHSGSVVFTGHGPGYVVDLVWTDIPAWMLVVAEQNPAPGVTAADLYNRWQAEGVR